MREWKATESEAVIRVLVVDDHEVVRRGLHAFLDGEPDLEVIAEASGGEEALQVCARLDAEGLTPDVVLMDLQMSPMDGIETTRRVRDKYPDVEVVALTSFAEKERVRAALESGASGYLLKDSEPAEVAAAVRSAHRGEIQLDPAVTRPLITELSTGGTDLTSLLTTRELEVLRLVGAGKANKEIASELVISERTARTHVSNVLRKIGVNSRTQAAVLAVREGLVAPPEGARSG
jgi:DNA-binding NarL/FixJ family response regulator